MATSASLRARQDAIVAQYHDQTDLVREVQRRALAELLPALKEELDLDEDGVGAGKALLQDRISVFRFCRRARFSSSAALKLLHTSLLWRLTSLRALTPSALPAVYLSKPLLFFHPSLVDRFGRPCAILNLAHVQRTEEGSLEGLKDLVRLTWEMGRRWLTDLSKEEGGEQNPKLQMVVIVDLEGAGMSNLEVELLPFFMDLLKSHFPGMVGGLFVINYSWAYSGMWQLAKRILPNTALERILFPNQAELLEFFEEDHSLVEHGGTVKYDYSPSNPILEKYGRPLYPSSRPSSAYPSPLPTPSASSASLATDVFHSAPNSRPGTPSLSSRRASSGLAMTPSHKSPTGSSWPWNWQSSAGKKAMVESPRSAGGLRRVRSLAELQQKLEQTSREIDSEDSALDSASEGDADESGCAEGDGSGTSRAPSNRSSRYSSRAPSRIHSRAASRDASPSRRSSLEPLTIVSNAAKASLPHFMSPFNPQNPHFGYPAYLPSSSLDSTTIPRAHRRKRDLVRTLTYLAALRFLSLHRAIQYRLNLVVGILLKISGFGWWQSRKARAAEVSARSRAEAATSKEQLDRKVHWAQSPNASQLSSASSSATSLSSIIPPQPHAHQPHATATSPRSNPPLLFDLDPAVFYAVLLFLIIRTPHRREKVKKLIRFLAVRLPSTALLAARAGTLRLLLGREGAKGALKQEKLRRM